MAQTILQPGLGPVEPGILYPVDDLKARTGFGTAALREARRNGLRVKYAGGRAYIKGEWFIDYIEAHGKDTK
jgi:hypothetical protein